MKFIKHKAFTFLIIIIIIIVAIFYWSSFAARTEPKDAKLDSSDIVVRGRIEPTTRVLALAGSVPGSTLKELRVSQGQNVAKGDVIAVLEGYDVQREALTVAERSLRYAESQHEQSIASAKPSEIAAQRNLVVAREAELERLQSELVRQSALLSDGFISTQYLEKVRSDHIQANNSLKQATNTLNSMAEFREVDKRVSLAKVDQEKATVKRARAELERTIVYAPFSGEILSIQSRPGEAVGVDGIVRIANTESLHVIAEVDEHFFQRIRQDTRAYIESATIGSRIEARVGTISSEIFKQKRPTSDVLLGRDARVIEVEVLPLQPLPVLLGGEVTVRFTNPVGSQ